MSHGEHIRIEAYSELYADQVVALAQEMQAESQSHNDMPINEKKLREQLACSHTMPESVYMRIAVVGETVVGGFFGIISKTFFSDELSARDMAWFVKRDRRGSMAALKLVADFEQWGLDRGVRKFFLGQSTGVAIETTTKLYEHLGYRVIGFNTVKDVSDEVTIRSGSGAGRDFPSA